MGKEYSTGLTTKELLQWLKDCVDCYTPKLSGPTTKEEYVFRYEVAKSVSETLKFNEIMLLYYLRNSRFGDIDRFMMIAQELYEANQALEKIKSIGDKEKEKSGNAE